MVDRIDQRESPVVLIVDDDPDILLLLQEVSDVAGWKALPVVSPYEALDIYTNREKKRKPIDKVISDLNMRYMNGIAMISELVLRGYNKKAAILTAQCDIAGMPKIPKIPELDGPITLIGKPFDIDVIINYLNDIPNPRHVLI